MLSPLSGRLAQMMPRHRSGPAGARTGSGPQGRLMTRSAVGRVLLAGCALMAFAASAGAADDLRGLPMTFEWRREGPADVCGAKCRSWVSAVGSITAETPRQFETFARTNDVRGAVIAFDSGGGSVLGTLELGRMIRRLDMTTTVGRTTTLPKDKNGD